jgi:hypothetical protein
VTARLMLSSSNCHDVARIGGGARAAGRPVDLPGSTRSASRARREDGIRRVAGSRVSSENCLQGRPRCATLAARRLLPVDSRAAAQSSFLFVFKRCAVSRRRVP